MKRIRTLAIGLLIATFVAAAPTAAVFAQAEAQICSGAGGTVNNGGCDSSGPSINTVLTNVVNVFSAVVAAVSVIMLIYGGFQLTMGGDDPAKIKTGRTIIMYSLVGLVVVGISQFLVQFVLHRVGGVG